MSTTLSFTRIVRATVLGPSLLAVDHGLDSFVERDVRLTEGVMPPDGSPVLFQCEHTSKKVTAGKIVSGPGPLYRYPAIVERIVDGDTLWVKTELWTGSHRRIILRADGINCPESHGEKACAEGEAAAAFTANLLPVGAHVVIATRKVDARLIGHGEKVEVHGRYLADIYVCDAKGKADTLSLSQRLISAGHAVEYHGVGKVA